MQRSGVVGASDRDPIIVLEHLPTEWLITLLCEDRRMLTHHAEPTLPTVAQVLEKLLARASIFEQCHGIAEWMQMRGDEDMPYTVCLKQVHFLKALLGTAYADFLQVACDEQHEHTARLP
jgi:hypothetical protein